MEYQRSGISDNLSDDLVIAVVITGPRGCNQVHCIRGCTNAPNTGSFLPKALQPAEERGVCAVNIMGSFLLHFRG